MDKIKNSYIYKILLRSSKLSQCYPWDARNNIFLKPLVVYIIQKSNIINIVYRHYEVSSVEKNYHRRKSLTKLTETKYRKKNKNVMDWANDIIFCQVLNQGNKCQTSLSLESESATFASSQ